MIASLPAGAVAPRLPTPRNGNARMVPGVGEGREKSGTGSPDFPSPRCGSQAPIDLPADELTALQGRFERAGFHLYELHDGTLIATGLGSTKMLHGIGCARAFLSMNGGAL